MKTNSENENKKTIDYFSKVSRKMSATPNVSNGKDNDFFMKDKTRLSKTSEKARMNGRVDAFIKGETFDESQTPPEELINLDDKLLNAVIERNIDNILSE